MTIELIPLADDPILRQDISFKGSSALSQYTFKLSDWETHIIGAGVFGSKKNRYYKRNRLTGYMYQIRVRRCPIVPKYVRRKMQNKSRG